MSSGRKVNPRKRPATQVDVERAKREAQDEAVRYAFAIFFTVLWDKELADMEAMQRVWSEVNDLSDSVASGYVSVSDLLNTLKEEYGVILSS
jgi:hypothetical protein